jgi:hypothetical protein
MAIVSLIIILVGLEVICVIGLLAGITLSTGMFTTCVFKDKKLTLTLLSHSHLPVLTLLINPAHN